MTNIRIPRELSNRLGRLAEDLGGSWWRRPWKLQRKWGRAPSKTSLLEAAVRLGLPQLEEEFGKTENEPRAPSSWEQWER